MLSHSIRPSVHHKGESAKNRKTYDHIVTTITMLYKHYTVMMLWAAALLVAVDSWVRLSDGVIRVEQERCEEEGWHYNTCELTCCDDDVSCRVDASLLSGGSWAPDGETTQEIPRWWQSSEWQQQRQEETSQAVWWDSSADSEKKWKNHIYSF